MWEMGTAGPGLLQPGEGSLTQWQVIDVVAGTGETTAGADTHCGAFSPQSALYFFLTCSVKEPQVSVVAVHL
jgi:hypothetical protein